MAGSIHLELLTDLFNKIDPSATSAAIRQLFFVPPLFLFKGGCWPVSELSGWF
jgi:hypothetical protein